jgi:hypothetical protein
MVDTVSVSKTVSKLVRRSSKVQVQPLGVTAE